MSAIANGVKAAHIIDGREPHSLLTQPTALFHVSTALAIASTYVQALAIEETKKG